MTRTHFIQNAVHRVGERGEAGTSLRDLLLSALDNDPNTDPRKVILNAMANLRGAMTEVRQELDGIDSIGM